MVRHDNLDETWGHAAKMVGRAHHLHLVQPPRASRDERARGIEADDGKLLVLKRWLEIVGDEAAIRRERTGQPRDEVVERHVVIARDDNCVERQRVEKRARLEKLAAPGALGEIARDGDDVGGHGPDGLNERCQQPAVEPAEVQIGKVDDRTHKRQLAGANTFNARASA